MEQEGLNLPRSLRVGTAPQIDLKDKSRFVW